jgi:two-component system phosphate regulon sensor histidine kinase PhoR
VVAGLYRRSLGLLAAAIMATALVVTLAGGALVDRVYREAAFYSLGRAAGALAAAAPAVAGPGAAAFCSAAAAGSGFRVTIVLPDGSVAADSAAPAAAMPNHGERPEVREALAGRIGTARRRSATLGTELVYAAAPALRTGDGASGEHPVAVVRIAAEVPSLESQIKPARWAIAIAALAFAAVAAAAASIFSRSLTMPMARLAERARAYAAGVRGAAGGLSPAPGSKLAELEVLGNALDTMAAELDEQISEAQARGGELKAVLDSMAEAVLALDADFRVRLVNPAALALFGIASAGDAVGMEFLAAVRSTELRDLARRCLDEEIPLRSELILDLDAARWFRVLAAPFAAPLPAVRNDKGALVETEVTTSTGPGRGLVIVLEDITELRRLERVRRDFVANVSHELRTPIQVVKGFAETLRDILGGATCPSATSGAEDERARALRYAGIIERNAARMENLVADLLALAALERDGAGELDIEDTDVARLLEEAVEAIEPKAKAKSTRLSIECPEALSARLNPGLVVQALVNLVDNAVKYSPADSEIRLSARREGEDLVLEVRDRGMGIPAKDLDRLFERFYRVDKARSRELGGTGLGLAIVKHIALAHGGVAEVESWEGEGSTFRLRLPAKREISRETREP